ncbi:MAG: glucoamylase family protein, partial [Gammaproteobacteria bacterium]
MIAELRKQGRNDWLGGSEVDDRPIRSELFSAERLEQHARTLAEAQKVRRGYEGHKLMPRVRENARLLSDSYQAIARAVAEARAITPSAEWLLDNFHVVEEQVHDITDHLPESYYRELPKLAGGFLAGYPRVYGIAWALVAHTDSRFAPEPLTRFVRSYQRIRPLTLGELWAIPITLRVVMVENLRRLAIVILSSQNGRLLADEFVDQIENFAARVDQSFPPLAEAVLPAAPLRQSYVVQIIQRLHQPHPGAAPSLDFLNEWLAEQGLTLDEVVHREHADQTAANLTVRNAITSMRAISAFDWPKFVEEVSLVDECLRAHPGYGAMDFLTRDRYRHAIEELAKRSPSSELEIARKVMDRVNSVVANADPDERRKESGYYLIGGGRAEIEKEIGFRPSLKQALLRAYVAHAAPAYLVSLGILTLLLLALPLGASAGAGLTWPELLLLALIGVAPASDIAVGLVNRIITAIIPPRHLPRLELKEGVPSALRTFVVVPTLFVSHADVKRQIDQMEIRYLSNPDGDVRFALLSDWVDADQEMLPGDGELLDAAAARIADLNARYALEGDRRFFLFHRKRLWNPSERKWMGWERKRGKLHEFNRLLRGATDTSFMPLDGVPAAAPPDVRYVITLDADTKLPIGTVNRLVGTAAHPLNRPVFDRVAKRVVEGYALFQPRITPTLPQRLERSVFQQINAGACGFDPYASAVSDVYQDLFGHGTYTGKGLYEVDTFEAALAGRVPENTQLSHDLFESVFARCALVSDIEFFEEFPAHTEVAASRTHRWARGDWQLLRWIFGPQGKDMPLVGRWQMLDNLRRSLSAPGNFLTLVTSWAIPGVPRPVWIVFVLAALALPGLFTIAGGLRPHHPGIPLRDHLRSLGEDVLSGLANSILALTLLAQNAWLMIDAILSTLVRLFITRRKLLTWVTAAQAKASAGLALKDVVRPLWSSTIALIGIGVVVLFFNPEGLQTAAPFLVLWWLAPFFARALSLPPKVDPIEFLRPDDALRLRSIGRRTWGFFTTFVTAEEHHLPPDNYQEDPDPVVAHRSSPTNIGLYLLSVLSARDFGWLGILDTVDRLEATLGTLVTMPRLHGHFYNWYDTRELRPLEPRYVSTVDSGNLAAHLLALAQGCRDAPRQAFAPSIALRGIADTLRLLSRELDQTGDERRTLTVTPEELRQNITALKDLVDSVPCTPAQWDALWQRMTHGADTLLDLARAYAAERGDPDDNPVLAWVGLLRDDVSSHARDVDALLPWIHFADSMNDRAALRASLSIQTCVADASTGYAVALEHIEALRKEAGAPGDLDALAAALVSAGKNAAALTERLDMLAAQAQSLFEAMDFGFVYEQDRHLFSLGYNVAEGALDNSYYDLLASEARLTSLVAIAKRDVPAVHWFHLGRRVTRAVRGTVLLSWSGSMFEYLMPSLVAYTPRYSLLDQTCRLVVKRQIQYAHQRGVPWGISESAFNMRDRSFTYQYSDFGVPGLGMKRGLGQNLVIAPYATALAAMYQPRAATENFTRLETMGALGRYGFFEALDFSPERLAERDQVAIVRCYMAHHQGMTLVALANVLSDGAMRHRFHGSPLIQAVELLLQERIPHGVDTSNPLPPKVPPEAKEVVQLPVRRVPSPTSAIPSSHVLSNGRYAVMVTAAGSGYSTWDKLAVTRWREDVTRDCWGSYLYLRDV